MNLLDKEKFRIVNIHHSYIFLKYKYIESSILESPEFIDAGELNTLNLLDIISKFSDIEQRNIKIESFLVEAFKKFEIFIRSHSFVYNQMISGNYTPIKNLYKATRTMRLEHEAKILGKDKYTLKEIAERCDADFEAYLKRDFEKNQKIVL